MGQAHSECAVPSGLAADMHMRTSGQGAVWPPLGALEPPELTSWEDPAPPCWVPRNSKPFLEEQGRRGLREVA